MNKDEYLHSVKWFFECELNTITIQYKLKYIDGDYKLIQKIKVRFFKTIDLWCWLEQIIDKTNDRFTDLLDRNSFHVTGVFSHSEKNWIELNWIESKDYGSMMITLGYWRKIIPPGNPECLQDIFIDLIQ